MPGFYEAYKGMSTIQATLVDNKTTYATLCSSSVWYLIHRDLTKFKNNPFILVNGKARQVKNMLSEKVKSISGLALRKSSVRAMYQSFR